MAEETAETPKVPETPSMPGRSKDEVALELMKFVAVQTGYGKANSTGAGFSGKASTRTIEEHADALLQLFERCRDVVGRDVVAGAAK